MNTYTPRLSLLNALASPTEKLKTLLGLVHALDDSATPRAGLVTYLYTVKDLFEEVTETLDLHDRAEGDTPEPTPMIPFHGQPDVAEADIRRQLAPLGVSLVKLVFELEITLTCDRCGAGWTQEHPLPPFWAECWRCPREEGRR